MTRHPAISKTAGLMFLCSLLVLPRPAAADTVSIGASGCNYIGFQFMLDELASRPGSHTIKLRSQTFAIPDGITLGTATQNYTFIGGYANCSDAAPTPGQYSTLDASGGNDGTAFAINGTSASSTPQVMLRGVRIRGGNSETGPFANPEGGGLEIRGRIYVLLDDKTSVEENSSEKGGGIYLRGDNEDERAILQMLGDSFVGLNEVIYGGLDSAGSGIHCDDHGVIYLDDGQVSGNLAANFSTGAIHLRNHCVLGSLIPSGGFAGVLNNQGGSISGEGPVQVTLRGRSSTPFLIYGNTGSFGSALQISSNDSLRAEVSLESTVIMGNQSQGSHISLMGNVDLVMEPRSGSGTCSYPGVPHHACSAIIGNVSGDTTEPSRLVSLADWQGKAPRVNLRRTLVSDNQATFLFGIRHDEVDPELNIENALIVDNSLYPGWSAYQAIIYSAGDVIATTPIRLRYSTLSGNQAPAGDARLVRMFNDPIDLTGSLLYNHPEIHVGGSTGGVVTHGGCLLTHEVSMEIAPPYIVDDPEMDAGYLPGSMSPALDRCSTVGAPSVDFHGRPRPVDQVSVGNDNGAVDIGALERPQDGVIGTDLFRDGFE